MFADIKNVETDELEHENLEVDDIMLGADKGDDRTIVFLPKGEPLVFSPRTKYKITEHIEKPQNETAPVTGAVETDDY